MPRQNFSKIDNLPEKDLKRIQSLAKNGYSYKYIFDWLTETGFKIAEATVKNWQKKYLESIASTDEKITERLKVIDKQERDVTPNPVIDDPKNLEQIRNDWGIPDIEVLDKSPETAIGASQKLAYDLFISVGVLCKNRLNLYQQGSAKFPIEQIKALKLIYEIYAPLLGVNELVSPNAAIKSLESYGYNLEGLKKANDETSD